MTDENSEKAEWTEVFGPNEVIRDMNAIDKSAEKIRENLIPSTKSISRRKKKVNLKVKKLPYLLKLLAF